VFLRCRKMPNPFRNNDLTADYILLMERLDPRRVCYSRGVNFPIADNPCRTGSARYAFTDSAQFGHLFPRITRKASVPQPNPKHKPMFTGWLTGLTAECSSLPKCASVGVPDVGSELARKLIAETHAAVELR